MFYAHVNSVVKGRVARLEGHLQGIEASSAQQGGNNGETDQGLRSEAAARPQFRRENGREKLVQQKS